MTSPVAPRDPISDPLLTPQNSALIIIDYQPVQVNSIASRPKRELVANILAVARLAKLYNVPVVISTVNVKTGVNQPTIPQLVAVFPEAVQIDRTTINAWEDDEFRNAVKATGRKKLIMAALWTEACLTFPALDAMREGYEVFPVIDAVGGTSPEAHELAVKRIVQAGAKPIGWLQLACELQRDWQRKSTAKQFAEIVFAVEGR